MTPILRTARLMLMPLQLEDAVQVQPLFATWDVVQYLADAVPWPFPPDGVEAFYREKALPAMARGEEWHWTLRLQERPETIIGGVSLTVGENNRGFWLAKQWWGRGLMTEAVEEVTRFWFEELRFPRLRSPRATANTASRRIAEKTGMRVVEKRRNGFVGGELPAEVWEITREEWIARRTSSAKYKEAQALAGPLRL